MSPQANDYLNMLHSNGISNLITKSARVMSNTSSLINHILTNDIQSTITPGIIQTDLLRDHYPTLRVVDLSKHVATFEKFSLVLVY